MTREELIRRINEALDSSDGLEGDLTLQRIFARDPAASDLADELARIDRALRAWPAPVRSEAAWEGLAMRIEERLDETLPPMKNPTSRPILEDDADTARARELGDVPANGPEHAKPPAPPASAAGDFSLQLLAKMSGNEAEAGSDDERFSFTDIAPAPPRVPGSAPGFIDPVAPPAPVRAPRSSSPWIGGALAAVVVAVLGIVVGLGLGTRSDELAMSEPPSASEGAPGIGFTEELAGAEPAQPSAPPAAAPTEPSRQPSHEVSRQDAPGAAAERASGTPARRMARSRAAAPSRIEPSRTGGGGAEEERRARPPAPDAAREQVTAEPRSGVTTASAEAEQVATEPAVEATPEPALPATPDRDAVIAAMRAIQPQVAACAGERRGLASVEITVGSSGRVRSAVVGGDFAGTSEGSCIARALRQARFPEFSQPTFRVTYPFQL